CCLFQRESRACRYVGIDLERNRRTTDGVVNTVQHVYDALELADRIGHLRSPVGEKVGILSKELNLDRFGRAGEVSDHVLQDLDRSEEHTSELQSRGHLVCRLLLEKKKNKALRTPSRRCAPERGAHSAAPRSRPSLA